jgi:hypothetical protein
MSAWDIENIVVEHLAATIGRIESPQTAMISASYFIME